MEKKTDKKRLKFSLNDILENNRILLAISVIIAFAIWIWVAIEKSPEVQQVISNVPVKINLENTIPQQLGLQIFGETSFTVDVTVSGKKYIISTLTADDITVEANTNYVDSPGTKTLQLKLSATDNSDDFTIVSASSNYIEVYFDTYKEIELPLKGVIDTDLETIVPDGCILGDLVCSVTSVNVSGPATEINRIVEVTATASVDSVLEKTTTFDPSVTLVTNDGSQLEYSKINASDSITMTAPVLKVVTLPTTVEFRNAPSYYINNPLSFSVSPSSLRVAIPVETVETTKAVVVDTIDFSDILNSYNTFNVDASTITSFKIMNDSVRNFRVTVNASGLSLRTFSVPASSITLSNNRDDFDVSLNQTRTITVTVIGREEDLEDLSVDDIKISVDTADKTISKSTTAVQGTVTIGDGSLCWAFGKYDIQVTVSAVE